MQMIPNGQISDEKLIDLQVKLGFDLDQDYVRFLKSNNGCSFKNSLIKVEDLNQEIMLDGLMGIDLPQRTSNLIFWFNEYGDEVPSESLIIGNDPGGGFFLLIKNEGVYYWDHSWFFEQSNEEENTYFVANSFTEFLSKIKSAD